MSKFFSSPEVSQETEVGSQHHLKYSWTIWYHSKSAKRASYNVDENSAEPESEDSLSKKLDQYLQTTQKISFPDVFDPSKTITDISTVEQLWSSLNNLKTAGEIRPGQELLVFKSGIKPIWEDPINARGGKWAFKFHRSNSRDIDSHKRKISLIWERLILRACGNSLFPTFHPENAACYEDISGFTYSVRKDGVMIKVWNTNSYIDRQKHNQSEIAEALPEDEQEQQEGEMQDTSKFRSIKASRATRSTICAAVLRVIRECDKIMSGGEITSTIKQNAKEVPHGLLIDYKLHSETAGLFRSHNSSYHNGYNHYNSQHNYQNHNSNKHHGRKAHTSHNNNYNNRQRENKSGFSAALPFSDSVAKHGTVGLNKSELANLGRRRRGIEDGVEGGEPSGLLFGSRRRQLQQQDGLEVSL